MDRDSDRIIRENLLKLLRGGQAHMDLAEAVRDFPVAHINDIFPNGSYTPWHLLEHIRITQWDILDFIKNPDYEYMDWPKDYWPPRNKKASESQWKETISKYEKDRKFLEKIVTDAKTDLYAKINWGEGQTILREILLVSDHTAYHVGEFAIMRQTMNTWPKGRK